MAYTDNSTILGINLGYGLFEERNEDEDLKTTTWRSHSLGLYIGQVYESVYLAIGYNPIEKLNADRTYQYDPSNNIIKIKDVELNGSAAYFTVATKLSAKANLSFTYKRSTFRDQYHSNYPDTDTETSIQSFTISYGLFFNLGGGY